VIYYSIVIALINLVPAFAVSQVKLISRRITRSKQ
jgi:hypothetical protein